MAKVAHAVHEDNPGSGNLLLDFPRIFRRDRPVASPNDERRSEVDPRELFEQRVQIPPSHHGQDRLHVGGGHQQALVPLDVIPAQRGTGTLDQSRDHRGVTRPAREDERRDAAFGEHARGDREKEGSGPPEGQERPVERDQQAQTCDTVDGHPARYGGARGVAHDSARPDFEGLKQRGDRGRHAGEREAFRAGPGGEPVAREVRREHGEVATEPPREVAKRMG